MTSVSTTKSGTNWLDRLRQSRGFPTGEEPDLDRVLSTSSSGSAPTSTQCHAASHNPNPQNDPQWSGHVTDMLSDLFNMGSFSKLPISKKTTKTSRKQPTPKPFSTGSHDLCSSDDLNPRGKSEPCQLASSGDNSLNNNNQGLGGADVEEKDFDDVDLRAYSRSEVVVMDTSLPGWKFDGWVLRKNDDWKIKERKIKFKSKFFGGKKKKKLLVSSLSDDYNNIKKGQSQNDRKEERFKEMTDFQGKVPQKRFPCPRPPEKLGNEGSSVVLLKSIPFNNSNVAKKLGKSHHKKRPKKMKIV